MEIPLGVFTSLTLLLTALGEFQEMTIWIAEEGPYLIAPVNRRSEELGSAGAQHLISGEAIRHPDVQLAGDPVRIRGRSKGHRGLISGGTAPNRQQKFAAPKAQKAKDIGNLANHCRPQHVAIEGQRASVVTRHKEVSQLYTGCWEVIC